MNDFLKSYGGHMAAYLTAALSIFQYTSPTTLGPNGPLIIAVVGALAGAASNVHVANASAAVVGKVASFFVCAILVAGMLTGCKTLPTPTQQAGITVAVDIATGAAIQNGGTTETWKARAVKFKAIATSVKQVNDAGTATLATLAADLQPQLALLPPADQLAAHALMAALQPYIDNEVAANPDLATTRAALDSILQAVIDACTAYGA
jgi:hypothetical protein